MDPIFPGGGRFSSWKCHIALLSGTTLKVYVSPNRAEEKTARSGGGPETARRVRVRSLGGSEEEWPGVREVGEGVEHPS